MRQFLWPLGVVVAFGLGLAAASFYPDVNSTAPAAEDPQALVRRLQMQVSTLQARLRVSETRSAGHHVDTTGQASASLESRQASIEGSARQVRGGRRGGPPQGEPQDDLSSPARVAKAAAAAGPATVDGALDRFYRYLGDGSGATGPARWRQSRELIADLKAMGDAGTQALARVLASGSSSEERRTAAQLLGEMQDPRALPLLQDVLDRDGDVLLRRTAAGALRRLESPDTIPVLNTLLANPTDDRFVRMSAAYGLAQMGQPQGINGLMQIFDEANADGRGRDMAFRALNSLNDERSLPFMRQIAASGAEPSYRVQAIKFLTTQGDQQSLPALQLIMQSPTEQPSIRDAASQAYAAITRR
jgi:HEAT repeats